MKKRSVLQSLTILILILTACSGNTATPISDEDIIATAVATMLSGLSTDMPIIEQTTVATIAVENPIATLVPEPMATSTPEAQTLLPLSLYYLSQDANGIGQIFRLGRDGATVTQVTSEPSGILNFDILQSGGLIVYISQHNLIAVDANGENPQVLAQDSNLGFSLAWSPDGNYVAYISEGVKLYSIATGESKTILKNQTGAPIILGFSPDGSKLIVSMDLNFVIYSVANGEIFTLDSVENKFGNLNSISWLPDSKQFLIFADVAAGGARGMILPGLWVFNIEDGSGVALLPTDATNCVQAPKQEIDGNLIYLYATSNGCPPSPHALVRSAADGITDRIALRPETFIPLGSLWTPDGQALVIVQNNGQTSASLMFVPIDSSLPIVTLMNDINTLNPSSLRWGP